MRRAITETDWDSLLRQNEADLSAERFERKMLELIAQYIPSKVIHDTKTSHEWLNDDCRRLIAEKRQAWGTDGYLEKRDACTQGLLRAYNSFVNAYGGNYPG